MWRCIEGWQIEWVRWIVWLSGLVFFGELIQRLLCSLWKTLLLRMPGIAGTPCRHRRSLLCLWLGVPFSLIYDDCWSSSSSLLFFLWSGFILSSFVLFSSLFSFSSFVLLLLLESLSFFNFYRSFRFNNLKRVVGKNWFRIDYLIVIMCYVLRMFSITRNKQFWEKLLSLITLTFSYITFSLLYYYIIISYIDLNYHKLILLNAIILYISHYGLKFRYNIEIILTI